MPRKQVTRRRRKSARSGGVLRVALVFALLGGVNVYIFFFRHGTSLSDLERLSAQRKDANLPSARIPTPSPPQAKKAQEGGARARPVEAAEAVVDDEGRTVHGTVGASDTLSGLLKREELPARTVGQVVDALARVFDVRNVRAGHAFTLRFDADDRLRTLEYRTTPATLYRVERKGEAWKAARETAELETQIVEVGGVIESSLYEAVKRSGESTALVAFFVDMFAWDINFYIDTQAGDRFKIVVEKLLLGGKFYKYGRVLAAEYAGRVGTYRAFWFEAEPGRGGYFNERGESIVKSLLKTPLKYVRISSTFDRHRFHPILHTERAHLGVDYAAPTGTPVWATAGGKVAWRGPRGGAGNCVMVAHPGGMESIYMHLSKFAKGLEVGDTVKQKQVIGYVGATGLATGPHLHFSVKMAGHFVDPLRLKPAREAPLPPKYREAFHAAIEPRLTALARLEVKPPPP
jgi:murein DD-endopeptidase MepM/ murein hydrolase activator NlpD